jgi:ABC-type branched-subunit amino acid transport system permease subunit
LPSSLRHTLFIVVPLLAILAVLPGIYQNHLLLFNFVIFLVLAQGVNIIYGFTGYLPFGYVGFFGAGAYGFAILVMQYQAPAALAVVVAGLVGVALGLLLTPLLRLSISPSPISPRRWRCFISSPTPHSRTSRAGPTAFRSPAPSIRRWPMRRRCWCWR